MDLQSHKRTLAIVHIVYGAITALTFLFIGAFFDAFFPFILDALREDSGKEAANFLEALKNLLKFIFYFLLIFCALPSIVGGIGILREKNWGMIVALIAGCIFLFSFPFGTVIGLYTIFVYREDNRSKNDKTQG